MKRTIIALGAATVLLAGVATATPPRGFTTKVLGATTVDRISVTEGEASNVAFVRVELAPDGTTGWHSHPSHVFVLVKSGRAVHIDDGCGRTVFEEGQVFVEEPGHVHKVINPGDEPAVFIATFVGLPPDAPALTDEPNQCR